MGNAWDAIRIELSATNKHVLWIAVAIGFLIGLWIPHD